MWWRRVIHSDLTQYCFFTFMLHFVNVIVIFLARSVVHFNHAFPRLKQSESSMNVSHPSCSVIHPMKTTIETLVQFTTSSLCRCQCCASTQLTTSFPPIMVSPPDLLGLLERFLPVTKSAWLWHLSLGLKWTNQPVVKVITLSHPCFSSAIPVDAVKQNPNVALLITCHGGHIGFLEGLWPRQSTYMDRVFQQFTKAVFENGSGLNDLHWPSLSITSVYSH